MAGREKIKVYQFDLKNRKQKTWDCMQEVKDFYYNGRKYPMFVINPDYHKLPDGTYVTKKKFNRKELESLIKKTESVYVCLLKENKKTQNNELEVFNLNNEKIAEFKNIKIAAKLTNVPYGTIQSQLHKAKGKKTHPSELIFKFKT